MSKITSGTFNATRNIYTNRYDIIKTLIIGWGKMGSAIGHGIIDSGSATVTALSPSERKIEGVTYHQKAETIGDIKFDAIVCAVKPQTFQEVFTGYDFSRNLKRGGSFVSTMAGTSISTIEKFFPETSIIRTMPNLPAKIRQSVTGAFANSYTSEDQRKMVDSLLASVGDVIWVNKEDKIDTITATVGSGPGFLFQIMQDYQKAVEEMGFNEEEARRMTRNLFAGSANLALSSSQSHEELRNAVTSKGGTTAAGLEKLMEGDKIREILITTMKAAENRAKELAKIAAEDKSKACSTTPSKNTIESFS